jgi:hypothetical protein
MYIIAVIGDLYSPAYLRWRVKRYGVEFFRAVESYPRNPRIVRILIQGECFQFFVWNERRSGKGVCTQILIGAVHNGFPEVMVSIFTRGQVFRTTATGCFRKTNSQPLALPTLLQIRHGAAMA